MDPLLNWVQPNLLVPGVVLLLVVLLSRRGSSHKAPVVSYWFPWIGSAFALGADPDGFFRRAAQKYGSVFTVKAFGRKVTYVTSPSLMSEVSRNSEKFYFSKIRMDFGAQMFMMDPKYAYSPIMTDKLFPAHHKSLSPTEIKPLLKRYAKYAFTGLMESLDQVDGANTMFSSFLLPLAYRATAYAYFGSSFPAKETYMPFRQFDSAFHLMLAGVPKILLRKNYQAWEEVLRLVEGYLQTPHDDSIEHIRSMEQIVKEEGFTDRDSATSAATDLWALQANAMMAAFWIIVLQIQRPEGLTPLVNEIDAARASWISNNPNRDFVDCIYEFTAEASLPLLVSTIQESLRHSTSIMSIRDVREPLEFAGYQFDKGEQVICAVRSIHLDEDIHEDPQHFIPDRYLKVKKFMKNGKQVPNHSMPFGMGVSKCEGRHFAMGELKILVTVLLLYSTVEIDPKSTERPSYNMERLGVGVFPPKGDLPVIIRKRLQQ